MNKKAGIIGPFLNASFIYAIILGGIFLIVGFSGGISVISRITQAFASQPTWLIVTEVFLLLFLMIGGKR